MLVLKNITLAIIAILLIALVLTPIVYVAYVVACEPTTNSETNLYPMTAVVYELDRENDLVTVEDANGNLWQFEGCEDWDINDICSMLMDDCGTASIYDDEIVMVRYSGTTEGF